MIDLHAHVLPGIDDGPATLEDSLALLRTMEAQGVRTVITGAHTLDGKYNATREAVIAATDLVNAELRRGGHAITVLPGMELYLGFDLLRALRSGAVMGLNQSRHILVELPHREFPMYTERALFEVMIAGFRPILNHPERNAEIRRRPELMYRLADKGVPALVTAASLLGRFGAESQALAEEFVREGVAPYICSDAHDLKGRAPLLADGLAAAKAFGKLDQAAEAALLS
ncbi:MAG TPA: CpsB/CapC family capsule biosynthesis tyrosine phosphatase [Symbiobacteriaceae bacterium]|nr:CpsB/CapC family capsule biosynthesis tyrosine phosphatase [Symbiobacteriaceae bacterium]